jgi:hypothetical protein
MQAEADSRREWKTRKAKARKANASRSRFPEGMEDKKSKGKKSKCKQKQIPGGNGRQEKQRQERQMQVEADSRREWKTRKAKARKAKARKAKARKANARKANASSSRFPEGLGVRVGFSDCEYLVHTVCSAVRQMPDGPFPAPPDVEFPGAAATRFFRRPARLGWTPVAGQVLRMDAIGRLTAPPQYEAGLATNSVCGFMPHGFSPFESWGKSLERLSGTPSSARGLRTEREAEFSGRARQTPPPVSAAQFLSGFPGEA